VALGAFHDVQLAGRVIRVTGKIGNPRRTSASGEE